MDNLTFPAFLYTLSRSSKCVRTELSWERSKNSKSTSDFQLLVCIRIFYSNDSKYLSSISPNYLIKDSHGDVRAPVFLETHSGDSATQHNFRVVDFDYMLTMHQGLY